MNYVPRLTDAGMNIYGSSVWNWYAGPDNPFASSGGLRMPNCTTYCCGRYAEIRGAFHAMPPGNAGQWFAPATLDSLGFTYGTGATAAPQLGSIMVWSDPTGTYPGHVAIVEKIDRLESGLIQIITSNSGYSNWNGGVRPPYPPVLGTSGAVTGFYTQRINNGNDYSITYHAGHPYTLQGFIYNDATVATTNAYVVAAICGNFYRESGVNPGAWQGYVTPPPITTRGVGFGLGQWTNVGTDEGRLYNLIQWCSDNGLDPTTGPGQLEYLLHEANWNNNPHTIGSYTTFDEFMSTDSTDLYALTYDWCWNWEGLDPSASGTGFDVRYAAAQEYYDLILALYDANPDEYSWTARNAPLTTSETQDNVMLIYWYLSGVTPEPIPERSRKGMPVWMMTKKKFYRRRFMF